MSALSEARERSRIGWGLLVLRVVVGVVFLAHGAQKVFVFGHPGVTGMMTKFGVPLPGVASLVVMFVEFVGGAALILGVLTRVAAALLSIDMLVALLAVHLKNGFFVPMGVELVLTLWGGLIALVLSGSGALALDNLLFRRKGRI